MLQPPINNYCVYNDDFTVMVSVFWPFTPLHLVLACIFILYRLLAAPTLALITTSTRPQSGFTNTAAQ